MIRPGPTNTDAERPPKVACYMCGERLRENAVVRLFHGHRSFLFCSEAHAKAWDRTMHASSLRLNADGRELGLAMGKLLTPVLHRMNVGAAAIGRWARGH